MTKTAPRAKGLHEYRFKQNPHEKIAADWWMTQQQYNTLNYLLGDGREPVRATEREQAVAATLMQWLGSPVGCNALRELIQRCEQYDSEEKLKRNRKAAWGRRVADCIHSGRLKKAPTRQP